MKKALVPLVFVFPLLVLFSGTARAAEETAEVRAGAYAGCNLLLVSFDALQAAHMHCLGYPRPVTPTIDAFAAEGFLFENAVAQSSWTVPSHMSYFTSLYPSQHKVVNKYSTYTETEKVFSNLQQLSPGTVTLAEVLRQNGYATGGFTGDAGVGARFGFGAGFDEYFEGPRFGGMDTSIPAALAWLSKVRGGKKPFFVFLHGYDVHGQFDPPDGFTRRWVDPPYKGQLKGGKDEEAALRDEGLEKGRVAVTEEDARFWRALYDEKIEDVDKRFAGFVEQLKRMGMLDNTIVVLFSDHGTEFYEHKRFDHGYSLYEELVRVPVIIRLPNMKGGKVIRDQVRAIDLMPTLLELLGCRVPESVREQMQGVSLISLMNGGHRELTAFMETDYRFYACKRAIRTPGGLKFIYSLDSGEIELYDLKADPGELNNLADKDKRTAYELEQELLQWMDSTGQDVNQYRKLLKGVLKIKEY